MLARETELPLVLEPGLQPAAAVAGTASEVGSWSDTAEQTEVIVGRKPVASASVKPVRHPVAVSVPVTTAADNAVPEPARIVLRTELVFAVELAPAVVVGLYIVVAGIAAGFAPAVAPEVVHIAVLWLAALERLGKLPLAHTRTAVQIVDIAERRPPGTRMELAGVACPTHETCC